MHSLREEIPPHHTNRTETWSSISQTTEQRHIELYRLCSYGMKVEGLVDFTGPGHRL